jgi:transcriptional regulator with XRE-family HTH domain
MAKEVKQYLDWLKDNLCLSWIDISLILGISRKTISNWYTEKNKPEPISFELLQKLYIDGQLYIKEDKLTGFLNEVFKKLDKQQIRYKLKILKEVNRDV